MPDSAAPHLTLDWVTDYVLDVAHERGLTVDLDIADGIADEARCEALEAIDRALTAGSNWRDIIDARAAEGARNAE